MVDAFAICRTGSTTCLRVANRLPLPATIKGELSCAGKRPFHGDRGEVYLRTETMRLSQPSDETSATMPEMNFEQARFNMIEQQIRPWEVLDQRVLDVLAETHREDFVPVEYRKLAFSDMNIPLPHEQVMMAPKVEGRVLQALAIQPSDRVLEIGTGSGYLTACLAKLARWVTSVEIFASLSASARERLAALVLENVSLQIGDALADGKSEDRYEVIAVTGSLPLYSETLQGRLTVGGRLFVIVGEAPAMEALLVTRVGDHKWTRESLFETVFPALVNAPQPKRFSF